MRLESVVGLKQQLLAEVIEPFAAVASGQPVAAALAERVRSLTENVPTFAVGARAFTQVSTVQRSVALGIARHEQRYRLAIRVQRQSLLVSRLVDHLVHAASGEADVRLIGRIDKRPAGAGSARVADHRRPRRGLKAPAIRAAAPLAAMWQQRNARPLLLGASIGHVDVTAGTIGAFVTAAGRVCMLSNNHVLANEDRASEGDVIIQRGRADGGTAAADRVAVLRLALPLKPNGANFTDAAIAAIDATVDHDANRLREIVDGADTRLAGLGPSFLDEGTQVRKIGRTTGATEGRVTAFDLDNVVVNYDIGNLRFDGQVEIEGAGTQTFSDGGDSGSLIVNGGMLAVALLFAGTDTGGSNGRGLTYANPIHRVLNDLNATLLL